MKPELAFLDYEMVAHLDYPQTGPVDVYLRDHYTACPGHGGIDRAGHRAGVVPLIQAASGLGDDEDGTGGVLDDARGVAAEDRHGPGRSGRGSP